MRILSTKLENKNNLVLEWSEDKKIRHATLRLPENIQDGDIIDMGGSGDPYELPIASATLLGGIKVGNGLSINDTGVLSVTGAPEKRLVSISATSSKTEYRVGESIDVSKISVSGTYSDGSMGRVTSFSVSPEVITTATTPQTITVTENESGESLTATFQVTVKSSSTFRYAVVKHNFETDSKGAPAEAGTVVCSGDDIVALGGELYTWEELFRSTDVEEIDTPVDVFTVEVGDEVEDLTTSVIFVESNSGVTVSTLKYWFLGDFVDLTKGIDWDKQQAKVTIDGVNYDIYCVQNDGATQVKWQWNLTK